MVLKPWGQLSPAQRPQLIGREESRTLGASVRSHLWLQAIHKGPQTLHTDWDFPKSA